MAIRYGKNSIGQLIAALRKANGMTQQEVADRLNVSNKAVSRWERDECAPDLSVIPALAEMFGITCDELLRGERIPKNEELEKNGKKVQKQVKMLVNRTLSKFKTLIWISLTVAAVGLVCMFGISYGFYRPVIGFAVMLLFEVCALVIAVLAVSRTKDAKADHELFEMTDDALLSKFNNILGKMSFAAFYFIVAVLLISLPFLLVSSDYVNSVLTPYSYFTVFFGGIVLLLALVYLKGKAPYMEWIVNGQLPKRVAAPVSKSRRKMTVIQVALTVLAGILFVVAPYFDYKQEEVSLLYESVIYAGFACLLASIAVFVVFFAKQKEERKSLTLSGIRNILLIPASLIVSKCHSMGWHMYASDDAATRYDLWQTEYLWYALALVAIVTVIFALIETVMKKKSLFR